METQAVVRQKKLLLIDFAERVENAILSGDVFNGAAQRQAINADHYYMTTGPRAGVLEMDAGAGNGKLLQALAANECAMARHLIPHGWEFNRDPQVFMRGRCVRVEADWPAELSETNVTLGELGQNPKNPSYFIAGKSEAGSTVVAGLSDESPHILISGTTGAGKTVATQSIVMQLSKSGKNELILIDGKRGDGLKNLDRLRGVVGPLAYDIDHIRGALAYTLSEMNRRYDLPALERGKLPRLIVVFDEVQDAMDDEYVVRAIEKIVQQGRAAKISAILTTQHPTNANLGKSAVLKRCVPSRIALRVTDFQASQAAVGQSEPRADKLSGKGDSYVVTNVGFQRCQIAYVPEDQWGKYLVSEPRLDAWPDAPTDEVSASGGFSGKELAVSIITASEREGRPKLLKRAEEAGLNVKDGDRARALLSTGKDVVSALEELNYGVSEYEE